MDQLICFYFPPASTVTRFKITYHRHAQFATAKLQTNQDARIKYDPHDETTTKTHSKRERDAPPTSPLSHGTQIDNFKNAVTTETTTTTANASNERVPFQSP